MSDQLIRILAGDGSVRATAAETTVLVEELRRRQQTDPTATVALGRLATGAALMGSLLKGAQRLALTVEGNGPLQRLQAEAGADGAVRAMLKHPVAGLPPANGRFDVAGAIGRAGFLRVTKNLGLKEPYEGRIQLVTSEIGDDLATYFTTSEQTPSSVGLGVELGHQFQVVAAGGFLIQLLPGAPDELAARLEDAIRQTPPATTLLKQGLSPEHLLDRLFSAIPYRVLERTPVRFACRCSRDQTGRVLELLGRQDLEALLAEQPEGIDVTCEFCRERYHFAPSELAEIRARLTT